MSCPVQIQICAIMRISCKAPIATLSRPCPTSCRAHRLSQVHDRNHIHTLLFLHYSSFAPKHSTATAFTITIKQIHATINKHKFKIQSSESVRKISTISLSAMQPRRPSADSMVEDKNLKNQMKKIMKDTEAQCSTIKTTETLLLRFSF